MKPNILYIHTHDSGRYMEPYGHKMNTPAIMDFAERSILFRHAYCAGPTCSPSRSALLTGMAPHSNGMIGLAHRGFKLNDNKTHLANYLKLHGYETVLSGVQHESTDPKLIGYEKILSADNAYDYITNKNDDKPFFLSFGMFDTHRVFPESTVNPDYVTVPPTVADNAENRYDMACYITSMQKVDKYFDNVMKALNESKHKDNTIIIFTTDHGISFPNMKCNLYDTGIGVSLMINLPKPYGYSTGYATDSMVSHIDIFPTICDLTEIEKPDWLQGHTMLPIFKDKDSTIREEIFSEVTFHAAYEPKRCIRTKKHKLIKRFDSHLNIVPANIDACPSKTQMIKSGYLTNLNQREELYDLILDPYERVNLVNDSRYSDIYNELNSKLMAHMTETDDILLKYPNGVPIPEGARVNALSDIDPI